MTTIISGSSPSITFSDSTTQSTTAPSTSTFGFKNRIINGGMVIDQRNAGASVTVNSSNSNPNTVDRFAAYDVNGGSGTFTQQQSTTTTTGFINSLLTTVGTADTPTGNVGYSMYQRIEGLNISDLAWGTANAKTVTLSFWVRSSMTGNFPVLLQNNGWTVYYASLYNIPTANTWTQISITITGPTTGTWLTTNGIGIDINWGFGAGSGRTAGTTGAWTSNPTSGTILLNATGATQLIGTSGATFYITGVQLEVGSQATSFDFRDYGRELFLCQRYYYLWAPTANSLVYGQVMHNITSSGAYGSFTLPVIMRSPPTLTTQGTSTNYGAYQGGTQLACNGVPIIDISHTLTPSLNFPFGGTLTVAGTCFPRAINSLGYLGFNAEL
jgi:hypothetical protein